MKKVVLNLVLILLASATSFSQTKSSIAVANPYVNGLSVSPSVASKLIRLELIKLKTYNVYDEFDMEDIYVKDENYKSNCHSKACLIKMGAELNVDYMASGSYDLIGRKIVISIKIIDVKNNTIYKSGIREFDNQVNELQRMTEILIREMHDLEVEKEIFERLIFKNEMITSNNVGKVNNSGPRIGYGVMTGALNEYATRPASQGGLDIFPGVSMIGYQIEGQYVGTENFSALVEGIFNVSGLEQGKFMPTVTLLNGFRFGKSGWEFAFGPGFGIGRGTAGFFDTDGAFGDAGDYFSSDDWVRYASEEYNDEAAHPELFENGTYMGAPSPAEASGNGDYIFEGHADTRGVTKISTSFLFAFGRTFKAGALNIPVNLFYSSKRNGGMIGLNVGFNIQNSKKPINQ